ncbi:3-(3-hydroxy-phenyl)propionate hydroxylase, FAD/NAD(P)-binding [Gulosibacter molinativorax]|uniref:FAD-dependent monooxygenase n=1 Tax=Gulosibacter molinativorax TaxID=256821 RepID=UPI0003FEC9BF|nr:FAD-dependent monooxygenase [Gulosibacter molinativorax]QUY62590.1 3-(3-hydroxy-phenyl)propionate hydroxylase, FAD/NAD(P)-binding [Gulosibacter molinativorax]
MSKEQQTFDCIVVGAGPIGMTVAALLSAQDVSVLVIERNAGTSNSPKAISVDDESLRTYAAAGLVDEILPIIVPGTGTRYYGADGAPVFHARAEVPFRLGYPFKNPFAQPDLERVLLEGLQARANVTIQFGAELTSVDSREDGVRATYRVASEEFEVEARFLIGADGGRSTVRSALGISMVGRSHPEPWLVIDVLDDPHQNRYGMHHGDPIRPHVIVPGLDGRCRYEFLIYDGEGAAGEEPSFELIRELVAPYRDISPEQVERAVIYKFHGLIATEWSKGSSFLIGDAAHMMPPFAGQGLNSGIRDAANLSWKIAAVLRGESPKEILDTYQAERFQHSWQTIKLSEKLGRVVMTTSPRLARFRDRAVRKALETESGRDFFEYMKYRPSAKFTDGLVAQGEHDGIGRQLGQPRAFNASTRTIELLDTFLGDGWALFRVDMAQDAWPADLVELSTAAGIPSFDVPLAEIFPRSEHGSTLIDVDTQLISEFAPFAGHFVLVRPDHVVAAVWRASEHASVLDHLRTWWTATRDAAVFADSDAH